MFAALLAMALAQPIPPVGAGCGPGKPCTASTFTSTSGSMLTKQNANGSTRNFVCQNNSNGTTGSNWASWTDPTLPDYYFFGYSNAPTATASSCTTPANSAYVIDRGGTFRFDIHASHTLTEYFAQTTAQINLTGCSSSAFPSLSATSDKVMAVCNQTQWDTLAVTGSQYTGSTVAAPHPTLPTGIDLGSNYAGPRRQENCYTDPELTADPTCTGYVTAPTKTGTNCGANASNSGISAIGFPGVDFTTGATSGDYCSWSKTTGYVQIVMYPRITHVWAANSFANVRVWVGWRGSTSTLFGSDSPSGKWCAFRFSTAVPDTNIQACSSDGSTVSCTDTGIAPSTGQVYTSTIEYANGACVFRNYSRSFSLLSTTNKTTNLPSASTDQLFPIAGIQTLTTAAKKFTFVKSTQEHQ